MKNEKLELLLNKVVEYNQPDKCKFRGFLYKDTDGYFIKVIETDFGTDIAVGDEIRLDNEDWFQYVSVSDKPKLMKVKKDSLHYRLVKYVLGDNAPTPKTMQNGCPYFWLLLFSVLTVSFIVLWRVFVYLISFLPKLLVWGLEKFADSWLMQVDDAKAYNIYYDGLNQKNVPITSKIYFNQMNVDGGTDFLDYFLLEKYNLDKTISPKEYEAKKKEMKIKWDAWRKERYEFRIERDKAEDARREENQRIQLERQRRDEIRREKWEARMKPINDAFSKLSNNISKTFTFNYDWKNIIKVTKRVVGGIITLFLLTLTYFVVNGFAYGLTLFIDWSIEHWMYYAALLIAVIASGIIYLLFIFVTGWVQNIVIKYNGGKKIWYVEPLIYFLYYPVKYIVIVLAYGLFYVLWIPIKYVLYIFLWKLVIVNLSKLIWKALCALGRGLANSTGVFGEYFGASYSDYCPGIEWEGFDEEEKQ